MEKIIILAGPSGSGKTTIADYIKEKYNYVVPTLVTTRKRRSDDVDGTYEYVSNEEFDELIASNQIGSYNQENERRYSIKKAVLLSAIEQAEKGDINGAIIYVGLSEIEFYKKNYPGAYIIVTSFRNVRESVTARNADRNVTSEYIEERISAATSMLMKYGSAIEEYSDLVIYSDTIAKEPMLELVDSKIATGDSEAKKYILQQRDQKSSDKE